MKKTTIATALAVTAALGACSSEDRADYVLHYATYGAAGSDQSQTVVEWAERVEERSDGRIEVRFHYSQSLVSADDSLAATLDGRVDMAHIGSIYYASDLPMFTVAELPFEARNTEAYMTAVHRMYGENEEFAADFDRNNVRPLFPLPFGNIVLGLNQPAETPQDLAGRSIRTGGLVAEVLLDVGGNPVAMTANDIYESLERGVIDGYTSLAMSNLNSFGVSDSTPYLVDPGIGISASSVVVINSDVYESMPEDLRRVIDETSNEAIGFGLEYMDAEAAAACETLVANGTEFAKFSEDQVTAWKEAGTVAEDWVARNEDRGYDADAVLTDFRALVAEESEKSDYVDPIASCVEENL